MEGECRPHGIAGRSVDRAQLRVVELVDVRGARAEEARVHDLVRDAGRPLGEVDDVEDPILPHRAAQRLRQLPLTISAGLKSEAKSVPRHPSQFTQTRDLHCVEPESGRGLEDEERGPKNPGDPQVVGECRPGARRSPKSICVGDGLIRLEREDEVVGHPGSPASCGGFGNPTVK